MIIGSAKYIMITYNFQILKPSILNSIFFVNRFIFMYLFILKSFGIIFWISEEILCGWKMFLIISFGFETTSKTAENWESLFHTKFLQKANNQSITCLLNFLNAPLTLDHLSCRDKRKCLTLISKIPVVVFDKNDEEI